ncbi:Protein of unknown function [Marinobacter daqiaonensis]|uniref:DUF1631 family protein n=1 Tax=Marinobacter daqiaonensis TaxID=650891 RepID=A0A1I6GVL5_9GAMM|nr:DUF1631 family protein [Marinobacter daqiaonensis]SFR46230.1 Protein of unknown function [Marinobacter daqiaonensis]
MLQCEPLPDFRAHCESLLPNMPESSLPESLDDRIRGVLREIRVPDLPYPVGRADPGNHRDWQPMLQDSWRAQSDQRVSALIAGLEGPWRVPQVNAAYLADRIMDVFLRSSGLHPLLVTRLARLRYPLAWRLVEEEDFRFISLLVRWLDSFDDWRGWSDSGGRSSRALLDQLDRLVDVIDEGFRSGDTEAFESFCLAWHAEAERRQGHSTRLHQRLLETEFGAARQRRADQVSRALVGRALTGRKLPAATLRFVVDQWLPLLRQVAWQEETTTDTWRHATRLLEWMVWAGDPELSGQNLERLYQVGEQLSDRITEVWQRVWEDVPPATPLSELEAVLVERLRGGNPAVEMAEPWVRRLAFDPRWLDLADAPAEEVSRYQGQWFVQGSGDTEQRRFFLAFLEDTGDVLWSNGYGVRLGTMSWPAFTEALGSGAMRPLPPLSRFGDVLADTVLALDRVLESQRRQRREAARLAREKAEQLRIEKEAEEQRRREEEAARLAEAREQARLAREQEQQEEAERLEVERRIAREQALAQVDGLKMGGWIALAEGEGERRLKLAVRINASRKLVFVDRLGLNRTELSVDTLTERLLSGNARILGSTAEFDETLSRVVGRIRVGRR